VLETFEDVVELVERGSPDRVEAFGAGEGDDCDAVARLLADDAHDMVRPPLTESVCPVM
jgi:hypothetical protein